MQWIKINKNLSVVYKWEALVGEFPTSSGHCSQTLQPRSQPVMGFMVAIFIPAIRGQKWGSFVCLKFKGHHFK